MGSRFTIKDLRSEIETANEELLPKNSKVKFAVHQAYGGTQVVLVPKNPKKYGTGASDFTYGYKSSRETVEDFYDQWFRYGKETIKYKNKSLSEPASKKSKTAKKKAR